MADIFQTMLEDIENFTIRDDTLAVRDDTLAVRDDTLAVRDDTPDEVVIFVNKNNRFTVGDYM